MKPFETIPVLNRLLNSLSRSLPSYLADARPWGPLESEPIRLAIERLAADQRMYAQRVAEAVSRLGGRPHPGRFPHEFTAKHDLSLSFLLPDVIDLLDQDIALIEEFVGQLEGISALHALAEEILGNAKGHLDVLVELARKEEGLGAGASP